MPPFIFVLAFLVIVAFVVGAALLFRGFLNLPDASKIAPASEVEKIQAELKASNAETEKVRAQANTLAVQLDEMKTKLEWAESNVQALEDTMKESGQSQERIDQLEKDLQFLSQKADSQAREAIDVITRLAAETEILRVQSSAPVATADLDAVKDENQKLQIQVEGYSRKVNDLELAVTAAQDAVAKYAEVSKAHAQIVEENALFKKNIADLEEKLTNVNTQAIEDELQRVRLMSEEKILQANAAFVQLNSDLEMVTAQLSEKDDRLKKMTEDLFSTREELSLSLRTIHELKQVQAVVVPVEQGPDLEKENMQKRLEELLAVNRLLTDKEKILTQKLAQSRAQAISLERFCDDLKEQTERMSVLR